MTGKRAGTPAGVPEGTRMLSRRNLLAATASIPLMLTGCAGRLLNSGEAPRLFSLSPATEFTAGLPRVEWQLLVETPLAHSGIDSTRIALLQASNELNYYSNANWIDTAPEMVQQFLVESFENTNRIVSVGREATGLRSDFVLKTDLRDFQAEYGSGDISSTAPTVHVRLACKLVRMPRRNIVASDTFTARVRADSSRLVDIIAAFDNALEAAMRRAVEWTLRQGASNVQTDPLPQQPAV